MNMSPESIKARKAYFASKKPVSEKPRLKPPSLDRIEAALRLHSGNITKTAEYLGYEHTYRLRLRIQKSRKLEALLHEMKENVVDHAENQLFEQVKAGNMTAIIFVLKTLGRKRGYIEKAVLEHEVSEDTIKNSAKLIESMRKGMQKMREEVEENPPVDIKDYTWDVPPAPTLLLENPGKSEEDTQARKSQLEKET